MLMAKVMTPYHFEINRCGHAISTAWCNSGKKDIEKIYEI
ncbi:hypothetical protein ANACOL_00704 [Anaerotruncus colihominis DSM 17241]|uniref:Uncharacterized protein n=1 Tax=Anaerotruncus colihominis DSM 17241 TaxID=445972 RepID=B0P7H3_9FIRM|nr:hypothetical protein ANACOL_00704 [Anaerotruncus colihominis DSM 17241]